jgi:hypothetical protein
MKDSVSFSASILFASRGFYLLSPGSFFFCLKKIRVSLPTLSYVADDQRLVDRASGTEIAPKEHNLLKLFRTDGSKRPESFYRLLDPLAVPGATVPGVADGDVRSEVLCLFRKPETLEQCLLEGIVPHRESGFRILDAAVDYPGPPAGRKAAGAADPDFDPR